MRSFPRIRFRRIRRSSPRSTPSTSRSRSHIPIGRRAETRFPSMAVQPRILIAPDAFKGTYSARQVAEAIGRGFGGSPDLCPLADGGEGTLEVLVEALGATSVEAEAHDPLGRLISAPIGWLDAGDTAIIEAASATGLGLLAEGERDAERASSFGTGELIATARQGGAGRIIVGVGGTASTDGGIGAIAAIDEAGGLEGAQLVVLCDVRTPFEDAARVYGPQKGADARAVDRLSRRLQDTAERWDRDPRGVQRTGAAGGLAGGLWAEYGARLVSGAAWVLDAVEFDARMARADAVVTGEGRVDRQTREGKLVGEVAARCRRAGKPLHVVAGSNELDAAATEALGLTSVQIAGDPEAMQEAGALLASRTR